MAHDVAHQNIEDVIIHWDRLAESRHQEIKKEELRIRKSKAKRFTDKRTAVSQLVKQ